MIETVLLQKDGDVREGVRPEDIDQLLAAGGGFLWIDVTAPTEEELAHLQQELGLHPLVMEDLTQQDERPHIGQWPGMFSLIFYAARPEGDPPRIECQQINLVVASRFLLTVHEEPVPEIAEVIHRWEQTVRQTEPDAGIPVHALLDTLVDGYFPCVDALADRVEACEDQIFRGESAAASERLFGLKKDLIALRRIVAPERDVVNVLLRREEAVFSEPSMLYFQDLYDHLVRIIDSIDTYRDLLSSAMDIYLTIVSNRFAETSVRMAESANRLNQTMQVLTSWSIILMSISVIAGIYGMNFEHMPELHWRYGYFGALAAMLLTGLGLASYFRRKKWL